ncbi:hypothetical protein HPB50_014218 [Hyalomma asiaticum]|uniref:Uncharacterized protein n=1 Tax=Hyalomma asiaticum TaxID=266040 RepID=A0ACB7T7S1_HYAAI|nr:hypothetical protein HPB50_014218 [Hyalomma asiaticum]
MSYMDSAAQTTVMGGPTPVHDNVTEMPASTIDHPNYSSGVKAKDMTSGTEKHPELPDRNRKDLKDLTVIVPEFRDKMAEPTGVRPAPTVKPTTAQEYVYPEETTEEQYTHPETPFSYHTPTIPEPQTTPSKKDTWYGLLCTIGTKLDDQRMVPDDRLCDYLFYDSVYKKGPTPFDPNNVDPALSVYLGAHAAFQDTTFGIGFSHQYTKHLKSELTTTGGAAPEMLDEISMKNRTGDTKCLTLFAAPAPDSTQENIYVEKFSKIFTPTIVVILSHYVQADSTLKDCRVVPPTLLKLPQQISTISSYKGSLSTAAEAIKRLIGRGVDASWAISVAMKGRWAVLKSGQPADFLSECKHDPTAESFGSYAEVCEDKDFEVVGQPKSGVLGALYRSKSDDRVFSFDNQAALIEKLCRVRAQQLSFAFGIVAYDVDYDDFVDVCPDNGFGPFTRLFALEDVLYYFRKVFDEGNQFQDCLKLA